MLTIQSHMQEKKTQSFQKKKNTDEINLSVKGKNVMEYKRKIISAELLEFVVLEIAKMWLPWYFQCQFSAYTFLVQTENTLVNEGQQWHVV